MICLIIQILFTIVFNYPNENADFTGINIWLIFVVILTYFIGKSLKTDFGKFIIYFFLCLIPLFIISRYFTLFDFVEPKYYGFNSLLYNYLPTEINYDIREFLFWQTGVSSGFNYEENKSNFIITFFTVPPIALFECLIKSIFPNLYIILLIQLPFVLIKKNILNWKAEK